MRATFRDTAVGTVLAEGYDEGARWRVVRGPVALCAYIGLPVDHPLVRASRDYDDLPLDVHGGLTYSNEGDGKWHPAAWYWWGWDYAHAGDQVTYSDAPGLERIFPGDHLWTLEEVSAEAKSALWDFHKLRRLAERAAASPALPREPQNG